MAGRRPRVSRDEVRGEPPLHGARTGQADAGEDTRGEGQARGYSWAPFEANNDAARRHGAYSDDEVKPRAAAFLATALEDPRMPDHLRSAAFAAAVSAWSRAEAMASLMFEWVAALGPDAMTSALPGTKAPADLWRGMEAHAATLRSKLGLDPVSYARIARDLGLERKATEDALELHASAGAEIIARRKAIEAGT